MLGVKDLSRIAHRSHSALVDEECAGEGRPTPRKLRPLRGRSTAAAVSSQESVAGCHSSCEVPGVAGASSCLAAGIGGSKDNCKFKLRQEPAGPVARDWPEASSTFINVKRQVAFASSSMS